ncbi:MAG: DUF1540 domain-containing protein [Planctomycetota bacterium]
MPKPLKTVTQVKRCAVTDCAYNTADACHSRGITMGNGADPACDTFLFSPRMHTTSQRLATVAACKATSCEHNEDFECQAEGVVVERLSGRARCVTYLRRAP